MVKNSSVLILSCLLADGLAAETIDISTLSEYELKVHRMGWCYGTMKHTDYTVSMNDKGKLHNAQTLIKNNGFLQNDTKRIFYRASEDVSVEGLLGRTFSKDDYNECYQDMINILRDDYVPNFSYMK